MQQNRSDAKAMRTKINKLSARRWLMTTTLGTVTLGVVMSLMFLSAMAQQANANNVGLVFGNLQPATTVGDGLYSFGVAATAGDNVTTVQGDFAYGFGMFTEARVRLGVSDIDGPNNDPTLSVGGELKYQFWKFRGQGSGNTSGATSDPFDLAFSAMFEYASFDRVSTTALGINVLGSLPFLSKSGRVFGPYGRFNVRLSTVNPDMATSNTDIKFSLTPGFMLQMTKQARAFAEINLDDNTGISFGVQFGGF